MAKQDVQRIHQFGREALRVDAGPAFIRDVAARGVEAAAEQVADAAEVARVVVARAEAETQPAVQGQV